MSTQTQESSFTGTDDAGNRYTLTVEQEIIETRTVAGYHNEPDPDWVKVDEWGHTHIAERKLLRWYVTSRGWCDDCRDEHEEGEWRCVWCGETIEPGTRRVPDRPVEGLRRMTLVMDLPLGRSGCERGTWFLTAAEQAALTWTGVDVTPAWLVEVIRREPDHLQMLFGVSA